MRRTFQDLAREASIVKRNICGHATEKMSELYTTVRQQEIEEAVEKVISLAGYRGLAAGQGGYALGMHAQTGPSEGSDEAPEAETKIGLTR